MTTDPLDQTPRPTGAELAAMPDDEFEEFIAESGIKTLSDEQEKPELTETERVQEFAARHGIPLPEGLHLDSRLYERPKP